MEQPIVSPDYAERVRRLAAKYSALVAADPTDVRARACAQGWAEELTRVERELACSEHGKQQ